MVFGLLRSFYFWKMMIFECKNRHIKLYPCHFICLSVIGRVIRHCSCYTAVLHLIHSNRYSMQTNSLTSSDLWVLTFTLEANSPWSRLPIFFAISAIKLQQRTLYNVIQISEYKIAKHMYLIGCYHDLWGRQM